MSLILFVDTSAIIKRFANEDGSQWMTEQSEPHKDRKLLVSWLTEVEIVAALMRKVRSNEIDRTDAEAAIARFTHETEASYWSILKFNEIVIRISLELLRSHKLRASDAIQLASAVHISSLFPSTSKLVFISSDIELNRAAEACGLEVDNPNDY